MKFVTIADTHSKHESLQLPAGDVLIHAGDVSMKGDTVEISNFLRWFEKQDFKYKILIAGNHDFFFEKNPAAIIESMLPPGIIYLNDNGTIIENIKIWGSPITLWFFNWAFNRHRGEPIKTHWDLIPGDTDILITHGPVFQILDKTIKGEHAGCNDLFNKIKELKLRAHICGHIHEAYGTVEKNGSTFINASVLNERYELVNEPIVFEI